MAQKFGYKGDRIHMLIREKINVAHNLVKSSAAPALSIWLTTKSGLDGWLKSQKPAIAAWVAAQDFKAESGKTCLLPAPDGGLQGVVFGLGDKSLKDADPWVFAKLAESLPPATYQIKPELAATVAGHAALGWGLAGYRFDRYKKADNAAGPVLIAPKAADLKAVKRLLDAIFLVRDLVNTPTSDMGPAELEAAARKLAENNNAQISTLTGDKLLAKGFATIHTVGRASAEAPRLIDIRWGRKNAPRVTLVGKGVCFDSGGLDLKPSSGMRLMKKDMGGAAHALGLAGLIMESGLDVQLRVLIPAVENAVSGNAFRPGDIIKTYKGLTVEVGNTDAEGRLVLCDALALGDEESPDLMIDFATLTGAARVALGPDVPPFFTDNAQLSADLARHSAAQNDPIWPLPLWMPYDEELKSTIADLSNVSESSFGGAITAALYLKRFVANCTAWVHLDVYAWNARNRPGRPTGGEAMGLRAVFALISERYGNQKASPQKKANQKKEKT
jgi:leucyl aminopeptidase